MSFWVMLQVIVDLLVVCGVAMLWIKRSVQPKDDPRLSRGLQLLQTKISVLEDLSDRTETQITQLTSLMEAKAKEIQAQVLNADKQLQKIEAATAKSLDVAQIFQDRIPHHEIIERQNTIKYVKAARLAHQGVSPLEIAQQVDLSQGEIEFITKVNRDRLQFSEEDLPDWIKATDSHAAQAGVEIPAHIPAASAAPVGEVVPQALAKEADRMTLSDLGQKFRQAISNSQDFPMPVASSVSQFHLPSQPPIAAIPQTGINSKGETIQVKKVVFPKVDAGNQG